MTVAEMESAIAVTLGFGSDKANGITKFIDKDLFDLYVKLGRQGDKPDWNIYKMKGVEDDLVRYQKMDFEYRLDKDAPQMKDSPYFDFIPLDQRNKNWMPKIVAAISSRPTLIAVGLAHLCYKTGVIMLLRAEGYRVEPVMFD